MNKSYAMLLLYEKFFEGEEVSIDQVCKECGISIPTFRRYIATLRDFFWEKHQKEIKYDIKKKVYYVK